MEIDENDKKILWMLQLNSKTPLEEIARMTGLTQSAVKKRMANLVEEGVIKNFTVIVDPSKFTEETVAITRISCAPLKKKEIASKLSRLDEVTEVHTGAGEYNILAKIRCTGGAETEEILQKINQMGGISSIDVFVALSSLKEEPGMKILSGAMINEQDVDADGLPELILSNPHIRLVVDPADGGRIKEYVLKKNWSNNVHSDNGILSDALLEIFGWDLNRVAFDHEKVQRSINKAALRLWTKPEEQIPGLLLEKRLTLSADSEALKVTYKLVNMSKEEKTITLWVRNYMQIGENVGSSHSFVLPVTPKSGVLTERFERGFSGKIFLQEGHKWTPFDLQRWKEEKTLKWPQEKVSEGWATYTDTATNIAFGLIWNPDEVKYIKRYFIYDYYSIELVFETLKLKPEESKEFSFTVISSSEGWRKVKDQYLKMHTDNRSLKKNF